MELQIKSQDPYGLRAALREEYRAAGRIRRCLRHDPPPLMDAGEPNGNVIIVIVEDPCASVWPAFGPRKRRNDHGDERQGRYCTTQQEPEGA
jgi:hypothetical protein